MEKSECSKVRSRKAVSGKHLFVVQRKKREMNIRSAMHGKQNQERLGESYPANLIKNPWKLKEILANVEVHYVHG